MRAIFLRASAIMQDNNKEKAVLLNKLEALRIEHNIPAIGAARCGDAVNIVAVVGAMKFGSNILALPTQQFHMGSCGKAVTALLIHKLAHKLNISLTAPLYQILKNFDIRDDYTYITLNDILTHCAGLPQNIDQAALPDVNMTDLTALRRLVISEVLQQPQMAPTKQFLYSNVGYILLGVIAAELMGQSYECLIKEIIFEPLKMQHTEFYAASANKPWGHEISHNKIIPIQDDNHPVYNPAGCIVASLQDWLNFLKYTMQYQQQQTVYDVLIDIDTTYTTYGFINRQGVLMHHGSNTLNQACVRICSVKSKYVVVATNIGSDKAEEIIESLADELLNMD
jgi:hypothetical protein